VGLKDITFGSVVKALEEYDRLGQEEFLRQYGFDRARLYVLVHDGKSYDSKAIVGAAHGYLPGEAAPLAAREFSGGEATVGRLLRKLGFVVRVGEELTADRLERLLAKLQVYRSGGVPALYQPITLLWAFGRARRGEPRLVSWQETQQQVKALLQWYRIEGDRVYYPIAALHNAGLWELDADPGQVPTAHGGSVPQRWFDEHQPDGGLVQRVYDLLRESPEALGAAVSVLTQTYFTEADPAPLLNRLGLSEPEGISPLEMSFRDRADEYQRLCGRVDVFWQDRDSRRTTKTSDVPIRSDDARRAVLLRSEGHCENPDCTGDIQDVTDRGAPILEVDHIRDLAAGGGDDPAQMIALCPNCHSIKTRGSTREQLRAVLFSTAESRHEQLAAANMEG
jgi:5-methylcytosine-specific restriction enzyme A